VKPVDRETVQLPYLETFSKAAELSSFTAAARVLGLTQAAVSQRVQTLEKALGRPLFRRQAGRVLLTGAGQKLYELAQQILALHRRARAEIAGQSAAVAGELLLAASSIPGEYLLPELVSKFGRMHPHVRVRATVADSLAVLTQVERGQAHLGLVGRKTNQSHLEFRHLASDRLVVVVPLGHELARRKRVSLKQLAGLPLVLREAGSGLRHFFEDLLGRAGRSLSDFPVALELGSNEAIKEAVRRGSGVAVLSVYAVHKEVKARHLRALEISDLSAERELFIVQDRRRVLPLPARLFLDFVQTVPLARPQPLRPTGPGT